MLKNFPIKLTMIITSALLCFKSKKGTFSQSICLHSMHETPTSPFTAHTLDKIMF